MYYVFIINCRYERYFGNISIQLVEILTCLINAISEVRIELQNVGSLHVYQQIT